MITKEDIRKGRLRFNTQKGVIEVKKRYWFFNIWIPYKAEKDVKFNYYYTWPMPGSQCSKWVTIKKGTVITEELIGEHTVGIFSSFLTGLLGFEVRLRASWLNINEIVLGKY